MNNLLLCSILSDLQSPGPSIIEEMKPVSVSRHMTRRFRELTTLTALLKLAKRIKKQATSNSSKNAQSARPAWSSGAKRKAGSDSNHGDTSPKRGRT